MTDKEYRKSEGISRSELFKLRKSPMHFKYEIEHPTDPTPALIFGQAVHKYVLEKDKFFEEFSIAPVCDRRTKSGREMYALFLVESEGKTVISQEDFEIIEKIYESVYSNKYADLLLSGPHELPFFWTDNLTGEKCKCRTDAIYEAGDIGIIVDLKTCGSADTDTFMRDAIRYGYDMQVAMYSEGVQANTGKKWDFVFIAVEKEPPYAVNILQADDLMRTRGYDVFRELLGIYHNCKETGDWYGYNGFSGMINNLSLPRWMAKEYE